MAQATLSHSRSYLHLNPVRRWSQATGDPTGSVLFFLTEDDVRGLHVGLEEQVLINELADYQPCTVFQWAELSALADFEQLDTLVQHLAEIGLVAWESE